MYFFIEDMTTFFIQIIFSTPIFFFLSTKSYSRSVGVSQTEGMVPVRHVSRRADLCGKQYTDPGKEENYFIKQKLSLNP